MTDQTIAPPATIAMLGGGQLGKYALVAANAMGYRTIMLDPDPNAPARVVADEHLVAAYDGPSALDTIAARCDVVTTEFENPPATALERLAESIPVAPAASCVAIAQDRVLEKGFLVEHGIAVGPHVAIGPEHSDAQLDQARALADAGAVLKTARLGYDGKGQRRVASAADLDAAIAELGNVRCVVEALLDLQLELSVLVARTSGGDLRTWAVAENQHVDGILDLSVVPARVQPELAHRAETIAIDVARALDYVGVLAVELFVVDDGAGGHDVLVNEMAPRPHNSGHWTLDASVTSQFEQQVRAVCNVGLGNTDMTAPAVAMVNVLGDLWFGGNSNDAIEPNWAAVLSDPDATLHLYGKTEPRRARKMGHITVTADSTDAAAQRAFELRDAAIR